MTRDEREALIGYMTEVEQLLTVAALRFASLKAVLVQKGLLTTEEVDQAVKMVEAALAGDRALGARADALARLRRCIAGEE